MKGYLANMVRSSRRGRDGSGEALPRPRRDLLALFDPAPPPAGTDDESMPVAASRRDAGPGASAPAVRAAAAKARAHPGVVAEHHPAQEEAQAQATNPIAAVRHEEGPRDAVTAQDQPGRGALWPEPATAPREASEATPRGQPWPAARTQAMSEWRAAATPSAVRTAPGALPPPVAALPDIHVTIGRIEVSAELAAPALKAVPPRRQPVMSLAQYEAKRREGTR
ncbi:hypothetical protein AWB74_06121 [Caballeronia arvi]|uniref:Uncharacterized protein n=1 Tax=Caballeronia arvi TaxID=1777135 RepID=A0A158KLH9_9BURK|nr:hypothetical protein [Caballeronia arvi]SAL81987.1 hypothetical protein AWB74_06121 [Caballeronia arvi]